MNTSKRFWSKVAIGDAESCWEWTAARDRKGYGAFTTARRVEKAHRMAWRLWHGEIESGGWVLHMCDNPACVNPSHLFIGTVQDNNADMVSKGRMPRGAQRGNAKLNDEIVSTIRRKCCIEGAKQRDIARHYGVSEGIVSEIVTGKRWRHVA